MGIKSFKNKKFIQNTEGGYLKRYKLKRKKDCREQRICANRRQSPPYKGSTGGGMRKYNRYRQKNKKLNKNLEILNRNIYDLPVKRDRGDFIEFLKKKYDEYFDTLKEFEGELGKSIRLHTEVISCQMKCIFSSLHSHYEGKPSYAYLQLAKCLEKIRGHLWIQTQPINNNRNRIYRIRVGNNEQFERKDLFHIPFNLRRKVRRQRCSITGLPCLYLSTSASQYQKQLEKVKNSYFHS